MPTQSLRAEHDAVLSSLSTRESVRHYGHAAVSMVIALVLGGTSGKLWWDFSTDHPNRAFVFAGLTSIALAYAAVRLVIAARANGKERVLLVRLRELRTTLGLDAPASVTQQVS